MPVVHVLVLTTGASRVEFATRFDPVRRRREDADEIGLSVASLDGDDFDFDMFAFEHKRNEHDKPFNTLMLRRVTNPGSLGPAPTISANISIATPLTTSYPVLVPHLGNTGGTNGRLDSLNVIARIRDDLGDIAMRRIFMVGLPVLLALSSVAVGRCAVAEVPYDVKARKWTTKMAPRN